jgi:hypothetical protein
MYDEVGIVEEKKAGIVTPCVEEKKQIESENNASADAGNARPMAGTINCQIHEKRVTRPGLLGP